MNIVDKEVDEKNPAKLAGKAIKVHLGENCWYVPAKHVSMERQKKMANLYQKSKKKAPKKATKYRIGDVVSPTTGVGILAVKAQGPAARAGLSKGDRIVGIAGRLVNRPADIPFQLKSHKPGAKIKVTYRSKLTGLRSKVYVTLGSTSKKRAVLGLYTNKARAEKYEMSKKNALPKTKNAVLTKDTLDKASGFWAKRRAKKAAAKAEKDAIKAEKAAAKEIVNAVKKTKKAEKAIELSVKPTRAEKKAMKKAKKKAVAEAVAKAERDTLNRLDRDGENYFARKARLEMESLGQYIDDRNAADTYLEVSSLREKLRADNMRKLKDVTKRTDKYLNKAVPKGKVIVKKSKLKLSKKGWAALITVLTLLSSGGATAAYFLI